MATTPTTTVILFFTISHRRVSMPVSFMTPECGCGATCDEDTFYQDEGDDILRRE